MAALGFSASSRASCCLPLKLRKSPMLGLVGSVNLALFKVAIICPISLWLKLSSPGRWEDPDGGCQEQGVSKESSLSLGMNEHGGHVVSCSWASLPFAPPQGTDQASTGDCEGLSQGGQAPCPAEAVKGSHQGLRHNDSTRCRDGKTESAWGLVRDPTARQQCVGETDLEKGP